MNVMSVAKYILSKESMSHKKLQKICYYSQAWSLVLLNGHRLIDEDFQAWVHGPVCPQLYSYYADYGWSLIPQTEYVASESSLSSKEIEVIDAVWDVYGKYSADELEYLTHHEEPWQKQRVGLLDYKPSTNTISVSDMKSYYSKLYIENQNE